MTRASEYILLILSEPGLRTSMQDLLQTAGYQTFAADSGEQAMTLLNNEEIDLIVSEYNNGSTDFNTLDYVRDCGFGMDVIICTSHTDVGTVRKIVDQGAYDLIKKPFHAFELLMSVSRALEMGKLKTKSRELQMNIEMKIKEQTLSLRLRSQEKQQLLVSTIRSLVSALEAKDKYTEGHSRRVADNSILVSQQLGFSSSDSEEIHLAGLLHDIGKIGIAESVLNKKGQLTTEEYDLIKTHPLISQKIVEQIPHFKRVSKIVRHHHEFYDGSGYPDGLKDNKIPIGARIMTVCDAYDAMTSDRSYRSALSEKRALNIIQRNAGTQFDPDLVDMFLRMKGYTA